MTFRLTKAKLFTALLVALCVLAAIFAVTVPSRRAFADENEAADENENNTPVSVTWEYTNDYDNWEAFQSSAILFTYSEGTDYVNAVRAKIVKTGDDAVTKYVYSEADEDGTYLSFAVESADAPVTALVNAAEYTVTINGAAGIADEYKTTKLKIAPRVTWEYYTTDTYTWKALQSGDAPFRYDDTDYSSDVRAKIVTGNGEPEYVSSEPDENGKYLSFAGQYEGAPVTALVNATEYTVTVNGVAGIADDDKTTKLKIAPRPLDFGADDLVDYFGGENVNRLWLLKDGDETVALRDQIAYYDPAAAFNSKYGAEIVEGELYNSYVRYDGKPHTVVINGQYQYKHGETTIAIGDMPYIKEITYTAESDTATGVANKVNEITTTARLNLRGNWSSHDGEKYIELTKKWYIVTVNNALRTFDGKENAELAGWTYGDEVTAMPFRPEHGDSAVFTLTQNDEVVWRIIAKYSDAGVAYYVDSEEPEEGNYYAEQLSALSAGNYTLTVAVSAYISPADHVHWWDDAEDEAEGVVYCAVSKAFAFSVGTYEFTPADYNAENIESSNIKIRFVDEQVPYNGEESNVPDAIVTFRGVELVPEVDYKLQSPNKNVGRASVEILGCGNFAGRITIEDVYEIVQGVNSWEDLPAVMQWQYGSYDRNINLITATPKFLDKASSLWFKIANDKEGESPVNQVLAEFRLTGGVVSDDVANALSKLPVGKYYLLATVDASTNYRRLWQRGVQFQIYQGYNFWKSTPSITGWVEGGYSDEHLPVAESMFGTPLIVIKNSNGTEIYNSKTGLNNLGLAGVGSYTLTARVDGTNDYTDLAVYTVNFQIFEEPGMPLWATLLIIFGVLIIVALVVFLLWKKGVFQILTGKLLVAIRTQAAVDATIAAIAANKKNEESKKHVAAVKRKEARLAKAEQEKALTDDERAAALIEKAKKTAERAEKMLARSEAMQMRAELMIERTRVADGVEVEIPPQEIEVASTEEKPTQEAEAAATEENPTEE